MRECYVQEVRQHWFVTLLLPGGLQSVAVVNGPRWLRRLKPKTTTHNAQRAGVRGRRKLRHPAPPPAPLLEVRYELEDRYRLPVCDGRHDDRRQPQPPPPPTPTTTTDDGRRRARVSKPRPAERYGGVSWEKMVEEGRDVVVVEDEGFRWEVVFRCRQNRK